MYRLLLVMLLLSTFGSAAVADDDFYPAGLGAAIDVGRVHTGFAYPAADYRADIDRYAVVITQPVAQDVDFGISGGYLVASVDSPSLATLNQADGQSLGLSAGWHPRLGNYLSLELQGGYRWNDVSFSSPSGQPDVTWYESYASAGPVLYLFNWRISAGLRWQHYDGTQTDPGPPAAKFEFSAARSSGAYLGLTYYLDSTGSLALYAFGGGQRGAQLVFKREF